MTGESDELVVRVTGREENIRYRNKRGLEAVEAALSVELGQDVEQIETEIRRGDDAE